MYLKFNTQNEIVFSLGCIQWYVAESQQQRVLGVVSLCIRAGIWYKIMLYNVRTNCIRGQGLAHAVVAVVGLLAISQKPLVGGRSAILSSESKVFSRQHCACMQDQYCGCRTDCIVPSSSGGIGSLGQDACKLAVTIRETWYGGNADGASGGPKWCNKSGDAHHNWKCCLLKIAICVQQQAVLSTMLWGLRDGTRSPSAWLWTTMQGSIYLTQCMVRRAKGLTFPDREDFAAARLSAFV